MLYIIIHPMSELNQLIKIIMEKKLIIILLAILIDNSIVFSQVENSFDLTSIDSIYSFFKPRELKDLLTIENIFTSHVLNNKSDIDSAYKDYLEKLLAQIDSHGYFSCEDTILVDFAKLDLKSKIELSTYHKIFMPNVSRSQTSTGFKTSYYDEINIQGDWVDLLTYYSKSDTIWKSYINGMLECGTFPYFRDTLEGYCKYLDFNNQMHRLIVLIHLINHSSEWNYEDCESTMHNI